MTKGIAKQEARSASMSRIDSQTYLSMLREMVEEGQAVNLLISGNSMAPFLLDCRDTIRFKSPDRPLKTGDMVFFQRDNGMFIMHRIIRVHKMADGSKSYDIAGDNQVQIEKGVREDQIFGLIFEAKRKGKMISPGDFWWEFFARIWPRIIPLRRMIRKFYSLLHRLGIK